MSETRSKFRTNQQEYSEPLDLVEDGAPPANNAKFIALIVLGIVMAVLLATLLSARV